MQKLFLIILIIIGSSCNTSVSQSKAESNSQNFDPFEKLTEYKKIIRQRKLNTQYVFVVDYAIYSGKKRMYLLDITKQKAIRKMMVAHGDKSETKMGYATDFSNVPESNKSSLGYCIVNQRAWSKWGIHTKYWLDGISKTNSNMRKRVMVMHSYEYVPKFETYPLPIITSLGCVMLSDSDMKFVDNLIKKQKNKKILMYIRA